MASDARRAFDENVRDIDRLLDCIGKKVATRGVAPIALRSRTNRLWC